MASEKAFTADGLTNLYSSITAEPNIILSTIRDRKIVMATSATSAIIPKIEETNSNFCHPSAFLMKFFKFCLCIPVFNLTLICLLLSFCDYVLHDPH